MSPVLLSAGSDAKGLSEHMIMLQLVTAGEQACRRALRSPVESFFL